MSQVTVDFVRKVFIDGADYVYDVPLAGLYDWVPPVKEGGKYEYQVPPVLRHIFDVNHTDLTNQHVRMPDKFPDGIYKCTSGRGGSVGGWGVTVQNCVRPLSYSSNVTRN